MKAKTLTKFYLLLPLILMGSSSLANDLVPANFRNGSESLQSRTKFPPDTEDGITLIRCGGTVSKSGNFQFLNCDAKDSLQHPFVKAVQKSAYSINLIPARVNDEPEEVWFNFSVGFERAGERTKIEVYPNHLYNIDEYGPYYTDPQRYGFKSWPHTCRRHKAMVIISAEVDSRGVASNTEILASRARDGCEQDLLELVENSSYIPATQDGNYVAAKYVEPFYKFTNWYR